MILFTIAVVLYTALLIMIRPAPTSLRSHPLTYAENCQKVRGSLVTGIILMAIYLLSSRLSFFEPAPEFFHLLALNNIPGLPGFWPLQTFTHLFMHANLLHLTANIAGIGLLAVYERRAGTRRFLTVLCVGSLASTPSIFFYAEPTVVCGVSGGVFALAAAYATDEPELNIREWLIAILTFAGVTALLSLEDMMVHQSRNELVQVDHAGHALGALTGILYCRLWPAKLR